MEAAEVEVAEAEAVDVEVMGVGAEAAAAAVLLTAAVAVPAAAIGGAATSVEDRPRPRILEAVAAGLAEIEAIPLHLPPLIGVAATPARATRTAGTSLVTRATMGYAYKRCVMYINKLCALLIS